MTDVRWSMSMITASVAPAGRMGQISFWILMNVSRHLRTYPMQPECQPPKTLHRTMLARRANRPFVRQMNLAEDPTLWRSLDDALGSQKISHQKRDLMRSRMVLGTTPNPTCKLLRPYRLCSRHPPKLLESTKKERRIIMIVLWNVFVSLCANRRHNRRQICNGLRWMVKSNFTTERTICTNLSFY